MSNFASTHEYGPRKIGQAFIPESTATLDRLVLSLARNAGNGNPLTVSIFEPEEQDGSNDAWFGAPLATSNSVAYSALQLLIATTTVFPFSGANRITLTSGVRYVAVVNHTNPSSQGYVWFGQSANTPDGVDASVRPSVSGAASMFSRVNYAISLAHPLPYYPDGGTEKTEPGGGLGAIVLAALPAQTAGETVTIYGWEDALQAYINSDEYQEGDPIGVVFSPGTAGNFEVRTYRSREHGSATDPQLTVEHRPRQVHVV